MSIGSPRAIIDISFRRIFPWQYLVVRVARESIYIYRATENFTCVAPSDPWNWTVWFRSERWTTTFTRKHAKSETRHLTYERYREIFDYWIRDIVWITKRNEINRIFYVWKWIRITISIWKFDYESRSKWLNSYLIGIIIVMNNYLVVVFIVHSIGNLEN